MKERITVTISNNTLKWIDARVNDRTFANRSHGFEYLIQRKIDSETINIKSRNGKKS